MTDARTALVLVVVLLGATASALGAPGGNGGQHTANSLGGHGKQPSRHEQPPPSIANGSLPAPSAIQPVAERSLAASRRRGRVSYRAGGPNATGPATPLIADTRLPLGVAIDASRGTVVLTLARDRAGRRQVIALTGGDFVVRQHGRNPITDIVAAGGDFATCPASARSGRSAATAARHRRSRHSVVRRLWARDNHGRFSTYGSNSVATVRGTIWLTEDRCDGTLTRVVRGRVAVYDRRLRRTVAVTAGHAYLARAR